MSMAPCAAVGDGTAPVHDATGVEAAPESGAGPSRGESAGARRPRRLARSSLVVLVIGLVVTALASLGAYSVRESNENRLLHQKGREVATLLTASIPSVSTPLASAALVAEATGGDHVAFRDAISSEVGTGKRFASASLWLTNGSAPLVVVSSA